MQVWVYPSTPHLILCILGHVHPRDGSQCARLLSIIPPMDDFPWTKKKELGDFAVYQASALP